MELRRFGVAMFLGFLIIGLIAAWREHQIGTSSIVLWSLGSALLLATLVPGLGHVAYLGVYLLTGIIGYLISTVLLTLIYFLLLLPIGLFLRWTGKDLLMLRPRKSRTMWLPHSRSGNPRSYYRQF
jgi:hypothetical protein